ncbi:MAG: hypothetical protein NTX14_01870 [Candidatus Nealsonbacteria bacterium]|nr:hypothetical protein [Candidatus Nealsonbacteria bacterium]
MLYNVPLKISEEKFFNDLRFDVTKFTDDMVIERIGAKFIRLVVEEKREELEKILRERGGAGQQRLGLHTAGRNIGHCRDWQCRTW